MFSAIEALKKEEEDEERRWRTQRRAHPTSPDALCAPDVSLVHLMVGCCCFCSCSCCFYCCRNPSRLSIHSVLVLNAMLIARGTIFREFVSKQSWKDSKKVRAIATGYLESDRQE